MYPDEAGRPSSQRDARGVAALEDPGRARLRQDPTTWVFAVTDRISIFILQELLLPLQQFLMETPWFTTVAGLTAIAFVISGRVRR